MVRGLIGACLLLLVGCATLAPAVTPQQLNHTAGAPIQIDAETVIAEDGTHIDYPDGWRVVRLNTAGTPLHLVFVSPDETSRIDITVSEPEAVTPEAPLFREVTVTADNGTIYYLRGEYTGEDEAIFNRIFEQVRDSIH